MNGIRERYPTYRESGVPWLGSIPTTWRVVPLKRAARLAINPALEADSELPFLGLDGIEPWCGRMTATHASGGGTTGEAGLLFRAGDVLFSKLRPYLAKALAPENDGRCTSEFLVLRPNGVHRRFLLYACLSQRFIETVNGATYGTKMPRASWDIVGNVRLPLPTDAREQARIVAFLDAETARIDALIERKEEMIRLSDERMSAITCDLVTKGVQRGVQLRDSGVPWIGAIPAHWKVRAIKRFARPGAKTFTDGDWIEAPYITSSGVRLIQTGNVGVGIFREQGFRYVSEDTFETLRCTEVSPADVLICRLDGPVGRACLVPDLGCRMITSVDNSILKPGVEHDPRYITHVLNHAGRLDYLRRLAQVGGGHRWRIARSELGELVLPCPPLAEQRAIAEAIFGASDEHGRLMDRMRRSIHQAHEFRKAIIGAAITGQIDVRNAPGTVEVA